MKKSVYLILLFLGLLGFFLRLQNIDHNLFSQDEAESAIYARQILETGYPHSQFRGETLYENRLLFSSDSPKYQYESTNFLGSRYEKNKGWLPYYLIALSFKVFGLSHFSARLPSVIIAAFSIFLLYFLLRQFFGQGFSLLATFFYAVNYWAIYYEQQARYFSLEIFLVLLSLYLFYLFVKAGKGVYLFFTSLALVLLFYTHIVMLLVIFSFLAIYHFLINKNFKLRQNKFFWLSALLFLFLTVPWLIITDFFSVFRYALRSGGDKLVMVIFILINIAVFFSAKYLYLFVTKKNLKLDLARENFFYLILFFILTIPLTILFIPAESISTRAFVVLLPFFTVFILYFLKESVRNHFQIRELVILFFLILWVLLFFSPLGFIGIENYDVGWVLSFIDYLKSENVPPDILILTTYNQFNLAFYSDNPSQVVWPLRCNYLRNYSKRVIFVTRRDFNSVIEAGFYYSRVPEKELFELLDCLKDNKDCLIKNRGQALIYDCLPQNN